MRLGADKTDKIFKGLLICSQRLSNGHSVQRSGGNEFAASNCEATEILKGTLLRDRTKVKICSSKSNIFVVQMKRRGGEMTTALTQSTSLLKSWSSLVIHRFSTSQLIVPSTTLEQNCLQQVFCLKIVERLHVTPSCQLS